MKKIDFRTDVLPLKNELFRLALHITLDRAEAEDVVQETLIKVWNRREQWEQIESIEAFALTVCRNMAIDRQRKAESRMTTLLEPSHDTPDSSWTANPEQQAMHEDRLRLVRRLISQLPEKQRTCMQLREQEGKSYKEIAQVMGISEDQVKINIHRARQTLRQRYFETEKYGL